MNKREIICIPGNTTSLLKKIEYSNLLVENEVIGNTELDYKYDKLINFNDLGEKMINKLFDFQKDGVKFCIQNKARLIIGDEMGIGKTIQALALVKLYKNDWPVLIFCPSSLKLNWNNEIKNWLFDVINESEVHRLYNQ